MSDFSAKVRLRPVRFAFLVRPDDVKRALEIFRINTCLWGGKFNPVIPCFKQVPKWWDRHNHRFDTAVQIVNGYLDFFEPDFIVEAERGLASGLGFDSDRILQLSDLLPRGGDRNRNSYGLSVFDLYCDLFQKEFQFVRRHATNIVDVSPKSSAFDGFCGCVFGSFPIDDDLKYFAKAFADTFDPKSIVLDGTSLAEIYRTGLTSALRIGHANLQIDYNGHHSPTLFVLDAKQPRDLIDFWNLRASRSQIIPVPIQWVEELSGFCKDHIIKNHVPLPGNPNGVMIRVTVMFARSISTEGIESIYEKHFKVDLNGANVRQDWYPSIWRPSPGFTVRETRPLLTAEERTFDIQFKDERPDIRFDSLHPEFAEQYGGSARWANVVKLRDWTYKDRIATIFPCNFRAPKALGFGIGRHKPLSTTEGLVVFPEFKNSYEYWSLSDGTTTIAKWLKTYGIEATLSDAGRATQQVIQTLGGFSGVASFAHVDIVKLLNKISRTPVSPSVQHQRFRNEIDNAIKGDIWRNRNFEKLVERGAVELGLKLACSKCSSWSWYSLRQLDEKVQCSLCLREFAFPIVDPSSSKKSEWSYRLIGPFALPNYANGGYAASLSIRFFADVLDTGSEPNVTWSAGQTLNLSPKEDVEADFILWYQRRRLLGTDYPTELVFGEAKSFRGENPEEKRAIKDAFQQEDIDRMKKLAIRFPGSILVFSTMKQASELSRDEIDRIRKLAEWGREYVKDRRQTRAPIIVLTGMELFASHSLRETWKKAGGKHAELIEPGWVRLENLRVFADMTQRLYLGMPSYHEWLEAKWEKRTAHREASGRVGKV
jgi:hypothetical protein